MFEQEILQNLVGDGAVFDNIKIELNRKRGQSLTFTISRHLSSWQLAIELFRDKELLYEF